MIRDLYWKSCFWVSSLNGLSDQVLEIEGQNVSTLGFQAVIAIAQAQRNIPPSIGVVSRIQQV